MGLFMNIKDSILTIFLMSNSEIKNLEEESKKLKNIGNINFQNTSEMKQSFLRILRNIKREIKAIRTIQKK